MTAPAIEPPRTPRMELLLAAALHVVAEHGLRGLTHRAVDRRAGLPEGSCSAYLRTRKALVLALTRYVAGSLTEDVEQLATDLRSCALGDDQAVETVTGFFMRWLDERELLLARMELSLEAARDPELADLLAAFRRRLVGLVESILSARGKDRGDALAETLVASFDGVLLSASSRPAEQRRPFVRQSMEVLIRGLG
jgi:DNA-binding transcriptional regulator YbjK